MRKTVFFTLLFALILASTPAYADIHDAAKMLTEGAVEVPVGLAKLVGGLVYTVGEVLILPLRLFA